MSANVCCPICGEPAITDTLQNGIGDTYDCNICGKYKLLGCRFDHYKENLLNPKERASLYWFLTQIYKSKSVPYISDGDVSDKDKSIYSIFEILNLHPKNIDEKINMILLGIASKIKYFSVSINLDSLSRKLYPMFFIDFDYSKNEAIVQFKETISMLKNEKLIEYANPTNTGEFTLTHEGWRIVQKLQLKGTEQAFIAMWFDPKMNDARNAIIKAIVDSGYTRQIIDEKEYNGLVVPEILSDIRKSKFIIAEFSGNRGGIYFEAGYAEGIKKPVIYTCQKSWFKKVHFDLKQENFIIWETVDELHDRLYKRIDAVIGLNK